MSHVTQMKLEAVDDEAPEIEPRDAPKVEIFNSQHYCQFVKYIWY